MPHCGRALMEDTNTGIIKQTVWSQTRSMKLPKKDEKQMEKSSKSNSNTEISPNYDEALSSTLSLNYIMDCTLCTYMGL